MAASFLIDVPRRIVFSRGWGVLTDAEVLAHVKGLLTAVECNTPPVP